MSNWTERDANAADGPGTHDETAADKREPPTIVQAQPAEQQTREVPESVIEPRSPAEHYEERLRQIWATTHRGKFPPAPDSGNTDSWELVQKAVRGVENLALISAFVVEQHRRQAAGLSDDTGLAGDPSTVQLLVSTAAEQLSPEQLPVFVADSLIPAVERLQREVGLTQDATREQIIDIVVQALNPLRGTPRVGRLVPALLGYLSGERRPPTPGIYLTVGTLAQLMVGLNDRPSRLIREFLYHDALLGMWRLLQDPEVPLDGQVRQVVSVSAGNAGMNLWQLLQKRVAGTAGAEVVRTLRIILTSTSPALAVPEAQAARILTALGLTHPEARAALTVIDGAGALGGPWTTNAVDMARIESAAAMTAVAARLPQDQVAVRLYNSAVSLQTATEPLAAGPLRARMLLHGLGLRWSLQLGTDLIDALDRLEGLDCASGFLRALGQYLQEGHDQPQSWPAVLELGALLAALSGSLPRDRRTMVAGAARLAETAGSFRLHTSVRPRPVSTDELTAATITAIDALRPSGASPQTSELEPQLLDDAALLRSIFEEILGQETWGLAGTIDELIELRGSSRADFIARYGPFAEPPGSRLGTGPPVAAGVTSPEEWQGLEDALLSDPGSIVPALIQEFPG